MGVFKYSREVIKLVERLVAARVAYYGSDTPIMSDAEFDRLEGELRSKDPHNKYFDLVGAAVMGKGTVYHAHPMLSMDKALDQTSLQKWAVKFLPQTIVGSIKMDGMSIELAVREGRFTASTRGDGEWGQDCTEQVRLINRDIEPTLIKAAEGQDLVIRGEAVLNRYGFDAVKHSYVKAGKDEPSNPRNAVVGLFNNEAERHMWLHNVHIVVYDILERPGGVQTSWLDDMQWFCDSVLTFTSDINLRVVPHGFFTCWEKIAEACDHFLAKRADNLYTIDGMIFRLDDTLQFYHEGRTSHHWKGQVAYKFPAQQGTVTIKSLDWSVGTKDITPVANFEPIDLGGAMIGRANLHSVKNMLDIGACIGAVLVLSRQGDVIPMLHRKEGQAQKSDGSITVYQDTWDTVPDKCPACGGSVTLSQDNAHLCCNNDDCKGKLGRKIEVFAKALGIDWVGPTVAEKIAELIEQPEDLLTMTQIALNITVGSKAIAHKIKDQIDALQKTGISLADFVGGLSVGFGSKTTKDLFDKFGEVECFTTFPNYESLRGVGRKQALKYYTGFGKAYLAVVKIRAAGFKLNHKQRVESDKPEVSFCITGTLSKGRKEIIAEYEQHGWKFKSGVSSALNYLVCNDASSGSSKVRKAEKLGIKIISEAEALDLFQS
jgi:DNA ligase (NAD+)